LISMKRPPGNIRRPPGLKIACFRKMPLSPRFARLALASEGGESKTPFPQRNKKLVAARTQNSGSIVPLQLPLSPMRVFAIGIGICARRGTTIDHPSARSRATRDTKTIPTTPMKAMVP